MPNVQTLIRNDLLRNDIDLMRFSESLSRDINRLLTDTQNELIKELSVNNPANIKMTKWRTERLTKLQRKIDQIVATGTRKMNSVTNSNLKKLARTQQIHTVSNLNRAVGVDIFNVNFSNEMLASIVNNTMIEGGLVKDWYEDKISKDVAFRTGNVMREVTRLNQIGLLKGESVGEMVRRIRGTTTQPGVMDITRKQVKALVRTSTMTVANETRQSIYNANKDLLNGYQALATLDKRTTPICRALDGKEFTLDFEPIGHSQSINGPPPWHWQCRSTMLPIVKSYSELAGKDSKLSKTQINKLEKLNPLQRASMGGEVSAAMNYNQWLLTQLESVQIDVLGKTRWGLWKQNKLTMTDLVHQNGRPLTVKELQTKWDKPKE